MIMKKMCATCRHDGVKPCNEPCIWCRYGSDGIPTEWEAAKNYEPQTNADRIRAMSDEELADMFGHHYLCGIIQDRFPEHCHQRVECGNCILEWLKQPAEE